MAAAAIKILAEVDNGTATRDAGKSSKGLPASKR
jgi:hypothetical protein